MSVRDSRSVLASFGRLQLAAGTHFEVRRHGRQGVGEAGQHRHEEEHFEQRSPAKEPRCATERLPEGQEKKAAVRQRIGESGGAVLGHDSGPRAKGLSGPCIAKLLND